MSEIITVEATVLVSLAVFSDGDRTVDSLVKEKLKGMRLVPEGQTFWQWFWWSAFGAPFISSIVRVKEIRRDYAGGE